MPGFVTAPADGLFYREPSRFTTSVQIEVLVWIWDVRKSLRGYENRLSYIELKVIQLTGTTPEPLLRGATDHNTPQPRGQTLDTHSR